MGEILPPEVSHTFIYLPLQTSNIDSKTSVYYDTFESNIDFSNHHKQTHQSCLQLRTNFFFVD